MHFHSGLPQGLTTLANARPGQRVLVRSVLKCNRCPPHSLDLRAGEPLHCTGNSLEEMEFERATGDRVRIGRLSAEHVHIDRTALNERP